MTGGHDEELWAAIAEPSRRQLLDILLARGSGTPTALADELPLTRQAITKHLAVLERAGLVAARRTGREVHYTVRPERLDLAVHSMAEVASQWGLRLQRIKRIAEQIHAESRAESADDPASG